ncbi:MAG: hypothetical protein GY847_14135 [Proteobacteria bacterium]|nr:hypothetical protein [Pseudomonadota bacterium]
MFQDIDLRELSEISSTERAFLTVYLRNPKSVKGLEGKIVKLSRSLKSSDAAKDEKEYLDENYKLIMKYFDRAPFESGSLCIVSCWALDFFKAYPLTAKVEDLIWIDSSPFIRPLAELQDEYENVAVVLANNKRAKIYVVSSAVAQSEELVKGNVKNHVRKGGWSQQRYERRRDKQLLHYAREIVDVLTNIEKQEKLRRIILAGGKETLQSVLENLPQHLKNLATEKHLDLGKAESEINNDLFKAFMEAERRSEQELWEKIRTEYLKGGLGVVGIEDVFHAVKLGRVESMIVNRDFKPEGRRCRECDNLNIEIVEKCQKCSSVSLYKVGVVNEIVELLKKSSAEVDFVDPIPTLKECGNIAALLRY